MLRSGTRSQLDSVFPEESRDYLLLLTPAKAISEKV